MMVEGDKWELYIPSDMAYGDSGRPPKIGGGDVLIFTIEIIKIKGGKTPASRCDVKSLEGCNEREAKVRVRVRVRARVSPSPDANPNPNPNPNANP